MSHFTNYGHFCFCFAAALDFGVLIFCNGLASPTCLSTQHPLVPLTNLLCLFAHLLVTLLSTSPLSISSLTSFEARPDCYVPITWTPMDNLRPPLAPMQV